MTYVNVLSLKTYLKDPWKTNDVIGVRLRSNIFIDMLKNMKSVSSKF